MHPYLADQRAGAHHQPLITLAAPDCAGPPHPGHPPSTDRRPARRRPSHPHDITRLSRDGSPCAPGTPDARRRVPERVALSLPSAHRSVDPDAEGPPDTPLPPAPPAAPWTAPPPGQSFAPRRTSWPAPTGSCASAAVGSLPPRLSTDPRHDHNARLGWVRAHRGVAATTPAPLVPASQSDVAIVLLTFNLAIGLWSMTALNTAILIVNAYQLRAPLAKRRLPVTAGPGVFFSFDPSRCDPNDRTRQEFAQICNQLAAHHSGGTRRQPRRNGSGAAMFASHASSPTRGSPSRTCSSSTERPRARPLAAYLP
jgi:hypothetical protein